MKGNQITLWKNNFVKRKKGCFLGGGGEDFR
jgi:hypothetical protein